MNDQFLLKRDDGKYVARPGSEHSYTDDIRKARLYPTRSKAEADRCDMNEVVTSIAIEFGFGRGGFDAK